MKHFSYFASMWIRHTFLYYYLSAGFVISLVICHARDNWSSTFIYGFNALWLALYAIVRYAFKKSSQKAEREYERIIQQQINELKTHGEVVIVDLSKCEIKSNSYVEEYDGRNPRQPIMATADLPSHAYNNVLKIPVTQSALYYESVYDGKRETFTSSILPVDKFSLLFLLNAQKQTKIYVDKQDRQRYYFDLEFVTR